MKSTSLMQLLELKLVSPFVGSTIRMESPDSLWSPSWFL
jgi:hypothetical protein